MVFPSAAIVIAPVPESVTVTFEFPCDTELVDIVVKLKVPLPSVFITCPALPSDVGYAKLDAVSDPATLKLVPFKSCNESDLHLL